MIKGSCEVSESLAGPLEEHFCELTGCSPWSLLQVKKGMPYQFSGYFEDSESFDAAWAALREHFPDLPPTVEKVVVDDQDWKNAYKAFLKPWSQRGLHWVPVWMSEEYVLPEGEVCVWFDAGMAFGTGSHETTRLCAGRLLDYRESVGQMVFPKANVIDAGCGSGILAISAVLLGARGVYGFDRDPEAAHVSVENAQYNLSDPEEVLFEELGIEGALAERTADLMLANIQADVLMIHAEQMVSAINPGGWLVLSGVLAKEQAEVVERFVKVCEAKWGKRPEADSRIMGEWCDVLLCRQ